MTKAINNKLIQKLSPRKWNKMVIYPTVNIGNKRELDNNSANSVKEYSYNENKNYPSRKEMQDYHNIIDNYKNDSTKGYFSLMDGHGGNQVVEFANEKLPDIFGFRGIFSSF